MNKGRYFQSILSVAPLVYCIISGIREDKIILAGFCVAGLIFFLVTLSRFYVITTDDALEARDFFSIRRVRWAEIRGVKIVKRKNKGVAWSRTLEFIVANGNVKINFDRFSPNCCEDVLSRVPPQCVEALTLDQQDLISINERAQILESFKPKSILKSLSILIAIGFLMDLFSGFQFLAYAKSISRWLGGLVILSILCYLGLMGAGLIFSKDKLSNPLQNRVYHLAILIFYGVTFYWLFNQTVKFIGR